MSSSTSGYLLAAANGAFAAGPLFNDINLLGIGTGAAPVSGTPVQNTTSYVYDPLGRLTNANRTGGPSTTFNYDTVGNRTSVATA